MKNKIFDKVIKIFEKVYRQPKKPKYIQGDIEETL